MDPRLHNGLEKWLGQPLTAFPSSGIRLVESAARSEPHNQFLAVRLPDCPGVLATGTARALHAVEPVIARMDPLELLSPLGIAEIRRALALPATEPINHYLSLHAG